MHDEYDGQKKEEKDDRTEYHGLSRCAANFTFMAARCAGPESGKNGFFARHDSHDERNVLGGELLMQFPKHPAPPFLIVRRERKGAPAFAAHDQLGERCGMHLEIQHPDPRVRADPAAEEAFQPLK